MHAGEGWPRRRRLVQAGRAEGLWLRASHITCEATSSTRTVLSHWGPSSEVSLRLPVSHLAWTWRFPVQDCDGDRIVRVLRAQPCYPGIWVYISQGRACSRERNRPPSRGAWLHGGSAVCWLCGPGKPTQPPRVLFLHLRHGTTEPRHRPVRGRSVPRGPGLHRATLPRAVGARLVSAWPPTAPLPS